MRRSITTYLVSISRANASPIPSNPSSSPTLGFQPKSRRKALSSTSRSAKRRRATAPLPSRVAPPTVRARGTLTRGRARPARSSPQQPLQIPLRPRPRHQHGPHDHRLDQPVRTCRQNRSLGLALAVGNLGPQHCSARALAQGLDRADVDQPAHAGPYHRRDQRLGAKMPWLRTVCNCRTQYGAHPSKSVCPL
jgi:hypothetical protein